MVNNASLEIFASFLSRILLVRKIIILDVIKFSLIFHLIRQ